MFELFLFSSDAYGKTEPHVHQSLQDFLKEWDKADGSQEAFDRLLESSSNSYDATRIGWDRWLLDATHESDGSIRKELIVSEDGLMLNTGIFFVRYANSFHGSK